MTKQYDNNSIKALKGADKVRLRPAVIFGDDGLNGCRHSWFEILSNSIDEAREGYGNEITVIRHKDKSITVSDKGRGIPLEFNESENEWNWKLIFETDYAGGKYSKTDSDGYEFSLGLNGLGTYATQCASEYMDVEVIRDGYKYNLHFEKGYNVNGLQKEKTDITQTGTKITWRPDLEVFTDINIPLSDYQEIMKKQAVVNKGIKFILIDEESNETFEYLYENGIYDYVKEINQDKGFTDIQFYEAEGKGKDRDDKPEYKVKMQVAFVFNNENNLLEYYHNSSPLAYGGSPANAVKNAFVYAIDKYIKNQGKYNKGEKKPNFEDIQDSLILVTNTFSTTTSYENQTKKAINNKFIQEFMTEKIKEQLEIYFTENKFEAEKISNQVLINMRSRLSAEKVRKESKKKYEEKLQRIKYSDKFEDCRSKDNSIREIYIVEGESSKGAVKQARNSLFQAVYALKGKPINCYKNTPEKIFSNNEIVELLAILGCGTSLRTKYSSHIPKFDINNLVWDKIMIMTDQDDDGRHIRSLLLTDLFILAPELIKQGKVYIVDSPLYKITCKKDTYFAYSDEEKDKILKNLNEKYQVQRFKGLGETKPKMLSETSMNPETRRITQVVIDDITEAEKVIKMFMDDEIEDRKVFIEENGDKYYDFSFADVEKGENK